MNNTSIIWAVVAVVVIGGGVYAYNMNSQKMMMEKEAMMQKEAMMKAEAMKMEQDKMMMEKDTMMKAEVKGDVMMKK